MGTSFTRRNSAHLGLVASMLVAVACASGESQAPSSSEAPGQFGVSYIVSVSRPEGGRITSADGSIDCGTRNGPAAKCAPASFPWSEQPTFTATPDPDFKFIGWFADCTGTSPTCTLDTSSRKADKWVAAAFAPVASYKGHYFLVTVTPSPGGIVTTADGRIRCGTAPDTNLCGPALFGWDDDVTLTATPAAGFGFGGWSGHCSGTGVCTLNTNPQPAMDKEVSAVFAVADQDGDGLEDALDNCPTVLNADQANSDADSRGDACDPCAQDPLDDADGDGVCADVDTCPTMANADQADADVDGRGDACDPCPLDAADDADGDGICANADNCPTVTNPGQADGNADGIGDACQTLYTVLVNLSTSTYQCGSYACGQYVCGQYVCGQYQCGYSSWTGPQYCPTYCTSYCNAYCPSYCLKYLSVMVESGSWSTQCAIGGGQYSPGSPTTGTCSVQLPAGSTVNVNPFNSTGAVIEEAACQGTSSCSFPLLTNPQPVLVHY
jgi:hypothetical protein